MARMLRLNVIAFLIFFHISTAYAHSLPTLNRRKPSASIYFTSSGNSNLQLFVNGDKIAEGKGSVQHALGNGDVIALKATHWSGDFGVAVSINVASEKPLVTGKAKWLATNLRSLPSTIGDVWMEKSYDACSWPQADLRSSKKERVSTFPSDNVKLNYVWAGDAGPKEEVYFRYVYNEKVCNKNFKQKISYASESGGELYVNQKRISTLDKLNEFRKVSTRVKAGDTVSIVSPRSSVKSGMILVVKLNKKVNYTTGSLGWKATDNSQLVNLDNNDLCGWPDAQEFSPTPTHKWVKKFRKFGATYIQTKDLKATNNLYSKQHYRLLVGNSQDSCQTYDARIYYAIQADNAASLFINGQRISTETSDVVTKFARRELKVGDVLSFRVSGSSGHYGLAAVVDLGNSNFEMTGQSIWRARSIEGSTEQEIATWMSPDFKPCAWSTDDLSISAIFSETVRNGFPVPVRGKIGFSWAGEADRHNSVLLRYRVGGEVCPTFDNRIYYSVQIEMQASVFINGLRVSVESYHNRLKNIRCDVKEGDVVAIKASTPNVYYGIGAAIQLDDGSYTMTGESNWRARSIQNSNQKDVALWMSQDFNPCSWSAADLSTLADLSDEVKEGLPAPVKSRFGFSWAGEADRDDSVLLRYRVGGEDCPKLDNTIYYAIQIEMQASLFINGLRVSVERNENRLKKIKYDLKDGDVVAIQASTPNSFYGIAVAIQLDDSTYVVTGESNWRARSTQDSNQNDIALWMKRDFNPCLWNVDDLSTSALLGGVVKNGLPTPIKNRFGFVWAGEADQDDRILLRHRVGGEDCPKLDNTIYYAVQIEMQASLFINGLRVSVERNENRLKKIKYNLKGGDVIAIRASTPNVFYGIAAAIELDNGAYTVTGEETWRAKSIDNSNQKDIELWMSQNFNPCSWQTAVVSNNALSNGAFKDELPASVNSRVGFVWASGAQSNEPIVLRYRVGGERC